MNIKIIKTEEEYENALNRIEKLFDAAENSPEQNELEVLALLVEKYESEVCDTSLPDPIEAIKFRMEQQGLKRKDLEKYIGSASKVSEVLNYKRDLSLNMIRALHEGLNISPEVLLQKPGVKLLAQKYKIVEFPFAEMFKRGYFGEDYAKLNAAKEHAEELLNRFFNIYDKQNFQICCRQGDNGVVESNSLKAWQAKILNDISKEKIISFDSLALNQAFIDRLVKLSYFEQGPTLVKEALNKVGIHFIILEHLPKTHLDGACLFDISGNPIIALTLRHDRLDNFWFTLMHELGHLVLGHLKAGDKKILIDDTCVSEEGREELENDADKFARECFISKELWAKNREQLVSLFEDREIHEAAKKLDIPAVILAGRLRWEKKNYKLFNKIIGSGEVKKLFKQPILVG